jgi:hypothetical protein
VAIFSSSSMKNRISAKCSVRNTKITALGWAAGFRSCSWTCRLFNHRSGQCWIGVFEAFFKFGAFLSIRSKELLGVSEMNRSAKTSDLSWIVEAAAATENLSPEPAFLGVALGGDFRAF